MRKHGDEMRGSGSVTSLVELTQRWFHSVGANRGRVGVLLARLSGPAAQRRQMSGYPYRSVEYVRAAASHRTPPQALCGFPLTNFSSEQKGHRKLSGEPVALLHLLTNLLMRVYVDGSAVYYSFTPSINQSIWMLRATYG